jgi:hypothetical protein
MGAFHIGIGQVSAISTALTVHLYVSDQSPGDAILGRNFDLLMPAFYLNIDRLLTLAIRESELMKNKKMKMKMKRFVPLWHKT